MDIILSSFFPRFAILIIGIAFVGRLEASASPNYDYGDMRSALQFLRDMDNYYGQIARPR